MNRIISINIKGVVFQIEEEAYDALRAYLERLRFHFREEEGAGEILDDIESRIAEVLSQNPGPQQCVTKTHVEQLIAVMGNPVDFGDKEQNEFVPEPVQPVSNRTRRLFRDPDNRLIGGVCAGLGAYFNVDTVWIRLILLVAVFGFGTGFFLYIILWLIVPEAKTAADRLEMRGENVTIDNIQKTVKEEFERVKKNFNDPGQQEKIRSFGRNAGDSLSQIIKGIGNILLRFVGLYLIGLSLFLLILGGLFYFGVLTDSIETPFFPLFSQLFGNDLLELTFRMSILLLVLIPLLTILFQGFRLLTRMKTRFNWLGLISGIIWFLSLAGVIAMIVYINLESKDQATLSKDTELLSSDTLYIESAHRVLYNQKEYIMEFGGRFRTRGIYARENDTIFRQVSLNIMPVNTGKMTLKEVRSSNGKNYDEAARFASEIGHDVKISEGHLEFNPYFWIPENVLWRNQAMSYDLMVPIGTVVVFGSNTSTFLQHVTTDRYISDRDMEGRAFVMTEKGLKVEGPIIDEHSYNRTWDITDFDEIEVNGLIDLEVINADKFFVGSTSQNTHDIQVELIGKRLEITAKGLNWSETNRLSMRVYMPVCRRIEASGVNDLDLDIRQKEAVFVMLNGASVLKAYVEVPQFRLEGNGLTKVNLNGQTDILRAELNGGGILNAQSLDNQQAIIEAGGGAEVKIRAGDDLNIEANGASSVTYYGTPRKNKKINIGGLSKVEQAK